MTTPPTSTSTSTRRAGWRLVAGSALAIGGGCAVLLAIEGPSERALSAALRATAATSLALFLLAFTASSINRLRPAGVGRSLLRNRRYLGLSFAVSHFIHLGLIGTRVAVHSDAFWGSRTVASMIPGATAYGFLALMTITSLDGPARALGRRRWKLLHTSGSYVIWAVFVGAYAGKLATSPAYAVPLAALAGAVALRAGARFARRRARVR